MNEVYNTESFEQYLEHRPYERVWWSGSVNRRIDFDMTRDFLLYFMKQVKRVEPASILVLAPGTGTWPELISHVWKRSSFDLLEPNAELSVVCKDRFTINPSIKTITTEFLEYAPGKTYDFFFSTSLSGNEPQVSKILQHMHLMLRWGGEGLIIAPVGRSVEDLSSLLSKAGMKVIESYPVVLQLPYIRSLRIQMLLFRGMRGIAYNRFLAFCTRSCAIYFKKM